MAGLVTEEQWYTVQRIIAARPRKGWRPGRGQHLLSGIAQCAVCSSALYSDAHGDGVSYYGCPRRGHVAIRASWLDDYVEDRVVSFLADPDVSAHLQQAHDHDDAVASAARADAERLKLEIEKCRAKGEDPDADAEFWERRSRALGKKLEEAEELARPASLSPLLAEMLGPDAADRWWKLRTGNLPVAKQLISEIAEIIVRTGKHGGDPRYRKGINPGRVGWRWLTGPGGTAEPVFGESPPRMHDDVASALRANPDTRNAHITQRLGCAPSTVAMIRRELEAAGEIPVIRHVGRPATLTPEARRARRAERYRERIADPEYREQRLRQERERRRERLANDPEYRERERKRVREGSRAIRARRRGDQPRSVT